MRRVAAQVLVTPEAQKQFDALPVVIRQRVLEIYHRLARWPDVSGAKPLREDLVGCYRIRTGGWRVLLRPNAAGDVVVVFRIDNRRDVYEK